MSSIDTHVSAFLRSYRGDAAATFTRSAVAFRAIEDGVSVTDYATAISFGRARAENVDATDAELTALAATGRYSVSRGSVGHYVGAYRMVLDAGIVPDKGSPEVVVAAHRVVQRGGTAPARKALQESVASLPMEERAAAFITGATAISNQPKSGKAPKRDTLATTDADRIDGPAADDTADASLTERLADLTAAEVVAFLGTIADRAWTVADVSLIGEALESLTETLAPVEVTVDAPAAQPMLSLAV
jgi:hypothetical protein